MNFFLFFLGGKNQKPQVRADFSKQGTDVNHFWLKNSATAAAPNAVHREAACERGLSKGEG